VETIVARIGVSLTTLTGVALLSVYPLTRLATTRAYADLARSAAPLLSLPLEPLRIAAGGDFNVAIPLDRQWRRIAPRKGRAEFLIVAATDRLESARRTYPMSEVATSLHILRNGSVVSLTPTSEAPWAYSPDSSDDGAFKFAAEPGDRIHLSVRLNPAKVRARSVLVIVPNWRAGDGEGLAIGSLVSTSLALAASIAGLVCLLAAIAFGWGRPSA
jgi:hypothetical protein